MWAAGSDAVLTPDETEFLDDSVAARDAAEARRRRLRRGVLTGFGVAALSGLRSSLATTTASWEVSWGTTSRRRREE